MKKQTIILIIVFLVGGAVLGGFIGSYYQFWKSNRVFDCSPADLDASVLFQGAAGTTYGTFYITNKSGGNCLISGNKFINANFDSANNGNVGVVNEGLPSVATFNLNSGQTIYASIRYPNGAQCQSTIHSVPVSYSYDISDSNNIAFKDSQGKQNFSFSACDNRSDMTQITISNLSDQKPTGAD